MLAWSSFAWRSQCLQSGFIQELQMLSSNKVREGLVEWPDSAIDVVSEDQK